MPWATRAHKKLYAAGRSRIENTNSIAKHDGGISSKSCRAPGPLARNMAALALAVVSNVSFAGGDPSATLPPTMCPKPSCHCSACYPPSATPPATAPTSTLASRHEHLPDACALPLKLTVR